jgi:ComF family protein
MQWLFKKKYLNSFNCLPFFSSLTKKIFSSVNCCTLCGHSSQNEYGLCRYCYQDLPHFNYEKVQGDLLNWPEIYHNLPNITFDHLITLAPHDAPFQAWISQLKYQGKFELAPLLGKLLAMHYHKLQQHYKLPVPQLVTCVPIPIKRWQQRGFNQTNLLSKHFIKHLSTTTKLPYDGNLIQRNFHTEKQVGQTGKARRHSLKNAFCLAKTNALPKHVLLIDDVITTGATASEISSLLKKHGAETVTLITITIALSKQTKTNLPTAVML